MKKMMIAKVATPKNTARIKKMIAAAVTALCMGVMLSMTVFADGASVDTSSFLDTVETVLKAVCILIGAGLGVWGVVNLIEGYGNDNPGANAHVRYRSTKQNKDSQSCHYSEVRGTQ